MNVETAAWRRDDLDGEVASGQVDTDRRRRRLIIAAAGILVLIVILAVLFMIGGDEKGAAGGQDAGSQQVPSVTVIVPGRQQVAKLITATGTLAAKRDMPVGVA